MAETLLSDIAETLRGERNLDRLVRRFLEIIEIATGLESAYLTKVDIVAGLQTVLFSRNTRSLTIPEGLAVPWGDTLCKRALDEGCPFTDDVSGRWGDSDAARLLGIRTYLSTPVLVDHILFGTLCGASAQKVSVNEKSRQLLSLFGEIIALYLEREEIMEQLQTANGALQNLSRRDALTGLDNRLGLMHDMARLWERAMNAHRSVIVAFVDLDNFKAINDAFGHDVGDEFLVAVSQRLRAACRGEDLVARIGGDEFVVAGDAPEGEAELRMAAGRLEQRLVSVLSGVFALPSRELDYAGPSIGVIAIRPGRTTPEEAIRLADVAMYGVKRDRRAAAQRSGAAAIVTGPSARHLS